MSEIINLPKNQGTKVLFKNRILEKLTRTHISVPLVLLSLYSVISLYWAITRTEVSLLSLTAMFFAGMFFWTFFEYFVHRFVWHIDTDTDFKKRLQYKLHGVHHEYPRDKDRLALPIVLSLTIATILLYVYHLVFGNYGFGFFSGFVIGYLLYLSIHYAIHAYQPPKNILKWLWIYHGIHHYKGEDHYYGVSSPVWDFIFRTLPDKKK
jgi:sterol desaturase/sphingolipid hydroxylase (fatty acid hydroxylase superfamily)